MEDYATSTDSGLSSPALSALSSPLSSPRSSISPPPNMAPRFHHYPSPPTSQGSPQTSNTCTPTPDGMESSATTDREGPPPAKRRRISRERTTEYLDLRSSEVDADQQPHLDRLLHILHNHRKIVAIAGAGISVSAGIPDFRSSEGLFRSLKEEHKLKGSGKHLFDASVYKDDTSTSSFHDMVSSMSRLTKDAKPTAFHHMLATIAKEHRLMRLYSQNVDGIDTSLEPLKTCVPLRKGKDGKWPRTVQLHGGLGKMVCSKCHELSDFDADLFSGPVPPLCSRCEEINDIRTNHEGKRSHGIGRLRPRMVLYNEHNPDDEAIGVVTKDDLRKRPDAVIVAGTTLKVPGVRRIVREMCKTVRDRRGGVAVWINNDLPPVSKDLEDCFDIIVQGPCDEVASRAAMRRWDEPSEADAYTEVSEDDMAKAKAVGLAEVRIPRCTVRHADDLPLPSSRHRNNTFRPPLHETAASDEALPAPFDWSPINKPLVLPSIETVGDNIDVKSTGLLTPTKSHKSSSPAKKTAPLKKLVLNTLMKNKQATLKDVKPSIGVLAKKGNNKVVKTSKATASSKRKPSKTAGKEGGKGIAKAKGGKPMPTPKVNMLSFQHKKTASTQAQKAVSKSTNSSPSKLRQVANASEPMLPVSPRDHRNNTSPVKKTPFFPGLASENASQDINKTLFT